MDDVLLRRAPRMSRDAYMEKLAAMRHTEGGSEKPNPVPMEPPVGYVKQPSIFENVRAMVRAEMAKRMEFENDPHSDEEDFDVDDDEFPQSRHEYSEDDENFVRSEVVRLNEERAKLKADLEKDRAELAELRRKSASTDKGAPEARPPQPVPPEA